MKPSAPRRAGPVDWRAVRARLAAASAATDAALEPPPERVRALLDERARLLARPLSARTPEGEVLQVLTFSLGRERYGIETRHVREVARLLDYTPVPGAPEPVLGVMNLRGELLAIADLRALLGLGRQELTDLSRVIVLGESSAELGVLADATHEIRALEAAQILAPGPAPGGRGRELLRGVTADALILIEGRALLLDERLLGGGVRAEAAT